eukprot:RCo050632
MPPWSKPAPAELGEEQKPILSGAMRSDMIAAAGLSKCRDLHRKQMGFEHLSEKSGPFHRCVEEYQQSIGSWVTAESPSGDVYWFDRKLNTQWQRPEPIHTDIKKALDKAMSPTAWEDYQGGEPWDVCEFLSLRWFGCLQRDGQEGNRCTKEAQDYTKCLQTYNHPTLSKPARRKR